MVIGFTHTAFFAADDVRVSGTARLSSDRIIRESGVTPATNVFYLDTSAVESLVERDPWVARATVTKDLRGTVSIAVVERVAVGVVQRGGDFILVSDGGTSLGVTKRSPRLPLLGQAMPGPSAPSVSGAASALAAMPVALRTQVASVSTDATGSLTMSLRSGVQVRYGQTTDLEAKAAALDLLLSWGKQHHHRFVSIDVTSPSTPAAVLPGGSPVAP
jgi:cell division protein FtsQ